MTSKTDAPDKKTTRTRRPAKATRHQQARAQFHDRAAQWLRAQPGKQMRMPEQLAAVVALGVPCPTCDELVRRDRQNGHQIEWNPTAPGHWAAGITAVCGRG